MLKRYVVAMPDIQEQQLSSQDDFLILASDGLWDVLGNQDAAQLIKDVKASSRVCQCTFLAKADTEQPVLVSCSSASIQCIL